MLPDFDRAVSYVLAHEGGFVDDPDDPGGATNLGISLRWYRDNVDGTADVETIRSMDESTARELYRVHWWRRYRFDLIYDHEIAEKAFDLAVNMGPHWGALVLQRALRACGNPVEEDGDIGPKTRGAIIASEAEALLAAMRSEAAGRYRELVAAKPERSKWLRGWLRRAYG